MSGVKRHRLKGSAFNRNTQRIHTHTHYMYIHTQRIHTYIHTHISYIHTHTFLNLQAMEVLVNCRHADTRSKAGKHEDKGAY